MDYYKFISEPRFFEFLLEIDRSTADAMHAKPCAYCGGKLNCGDFMRAGYGLPTGCGDDVRRRFSFCCQRDGCRKRSTPDSLRFMRGIAYATIVVLLLSAIHHGLSAERTTNLASRLNVSRQTVSRWIQWWRDGFRSSPFWRSSRGRFAEPFDDTKLPRAIVESYAAAHRDVEVGAQKALGFLASFSKN